MNDFKFSLEKMKEYKNQQIKKEKNTLMRLHVKLNALILTQQSVMQQSEKICFDLNSRMMSGVRVVDMQLLEIKKSALRNELTDIAAKIENVKKSIEVQQKTVIEISYECTELAKLEEKQKSEYLHRLDKENQNYIEEFISHHISSGKNPDINEPAAEETSDI
ncbi:MAG: hypothetical protein Q4F95_10855 [Oscillospiraceae bacterium]|nr:hypothetical protein [Oscillospiraceae bacterium]